MKRWASILAAFLGAIASLAVAGGEQPAVAGTTAGITCKVYATQYPGKGVGAALPSSALVDTGRKVRIERANSSQRVWVSVRETGPWNLNDDYWNRERDRFSDLPRCVPEAHAAYYSDYDGGKDEFGREVANPAGIDLTPAAARELGLREYQGAWVRVYFPFAR